MIKDPKMTAASIVSGAALAIVGMFGQSALSQESDDMSPARASGTQATTFQVDAQDIDLGKHWGN